MAGDSSVKSGRKPLAAFFKGMRNFLAAQKEIMEARSSTPSMGGINLVSNDYPPARLAEHPGYGSHEDVEPMK